ncbi:MAG: uracil-DNA glycosylase [Caldilineaceae bacterium]|nr:uracil-DNA glycosylase [Caldilineaceae bacterium]
MEDKRRQHLAQLNTEIVHCTACPRLVAWREEVAHTKRRAYQDETYWGKPITGFGDAAARLLLVGLAPGAHGANRTGRVFTGDSSGDFLYAALHRAGFANQPTSTHRDDGLELHDCYVTCVGRCAPPQNRPKPAELENCRTYLIRELTLLDRIHVVVALGQIAFDQTLRTLRQQGHAIPRLKFGHAQHYDLADLADGGAPSSLPHLLTCYHPSRQNTQTGVLTPAMMDDVFALARSILSTIM